MRLSSRPRDAAAARSWSSIIPSVTIHFRSPSLSMIAFAHTSANAPRSREKEAAFTMADRTRISTNAPATNGAIRCPTVRAASSLSNSTGGNGARASRYQ